eukprot:1191976-Prorocentrum_minimum.AAC.4
MGVYKGIIVRYAKRNSRSSQPTPKCRHKEAPIADPHRWDRPAVRIQKVCGVDPHLLHREAAGAAAEVAPPPAVSPRLPGPLGQCA